MSEGEEGKLRDFNASAPPFVMDEIALPAIAAAQLVVVLGEEWHTAEAMWPVSDLLHAAGCRASAVLLRSANNTMGFPRVDWPRLALATTITTVSRYMKHEMQTCGVNPLVIPNGIPRRLLRPIVETDWNSITFAESGRIPRRLLRPIGETLVGILRRSLHKPTVLAGVARWDPAKRWIMAVETVAQLKARGGEPVLAARGGREAHESEVLDHARGLGLHVEDVEVPEPSVIEYAWAFRDAGDADVVNLKSVVPLDYPRRLYAGAASAEVPGLQRPMSRARCSPRLYSGLQPG
ncbi:MAG TPA: hypothetical protein VK066_31075 [Chloroflexota bacterium]|nr:hypothetical protein [Chloroflexota bacterium]